MTVASVGAVTTTLVLVGIFLALMFNLNQLAENIENEAQMKVYVERTAEDQDIQALEKQINEISDISEMEFSSKEDELEGHSSPIWVNPAINGSYLNNSTHWMTLL